MAKIYLVEDNENIREAVRGYLELDGHGVREFERLAGLWKAGETDPPDLLLLDVMLPDGDGFLFAQRLLQKRRVPVIFLTARAEESDRITGLELGADDYVVKPFSPKELVLRVNAVLRRVQGGKTAEAGRYAFGGSILEIDGGVHRIAMDGNPLSLTAAEWTILVYLAEKSPQVFNRQQILHACLDSIADGSERTIDTHVKNIRSKLGNPDWIETVRGFGYRFQGKPE